MMKESVVFRFRSFDVHGVSGLSSVAVAVLLVIFFFLSPFVDIDMCSGMLLLLPTRKSWGVFGEEKGINCHFSFLFYEFFSPSLFSPVRFVDVSGVPGLSFCRCQQRNFFSILFPARLILSEILLLSLTRKKRKKGNEQSFSFLFYKFFPLHSCRSAVVVVVVVASVASVASVDVVRGCQRGEFRWCC